MFLDGQVTSSPKSSRGGLFWRECIVTGLYIQTGNILPLSAQGIFEWEISQCYLSWTYDRFCTLDKEKSNNNESSGKKKSLILISFSVYQKPFSIECDKISLKSCLLYLVSSTFPPQRCSLRNTVNAHMYPNVKHYLYFTYTITYFGGEIQCFLEWPQHVF